MSNTIPNFDGMNEDELMKFWSKYRRPSRKDAEALIGDRRPGYTTICGTLACYASNKATAMRCRKEGKLESASTYETHCDMTYDRLPEDLKW